VGLAPPMSVTVDSLIIKYLNSSPNYSTRGKYLVWVKVLNI
jgi:hypothetical protein